MDVVGAEELVVLSKPDSVMDVVGAAELVEALIEAAPAKWMVKACDN